MSNKSWLEPNSKSNALYQRAKEVLVGANTRGQVWLNPYPPYVQRGEGAYVYDVEGTRYLDLTNNLGVLIHGHAHPEVVAAAKQQVEDGVCFALPTESEIPLAELLCERVTNFEKVRFINTGSEAVAIALKAARAYTGKTKIAKMEGVYHGSYDFVEISNYSTPQNWGNDPANVETVKSTPHGIVDGVVVIPANDSAASERILREHADDLAAVIIDPVPPRCGMQPLAPEYVSTLRDLTRELGALLVYDEVIALRFGYEGSQGRFGGDPDLTALGKIIGGGYPVGAVAGKSEYMQAFASDVPTSGTFTGNPLTMSAGLASMQVLTREVYQHLDDNGDKTRAALTEIIQKHGADMQVTGTGSMFSIHPHTRSIDSYRSYYRSPEEAQRVSHIHIEMLKRGVLVAPTCTGFMSSVMQDDEIALLCDTFDTVLGDL